MLSMRIITTGRATLSSASMAAMAMEAHLEKLEEEGRLPDGLSE